MRNELSMGLDHRPVSIGDEDASLAGRLAQGDAAAGEALIRRYETQVTSLAYRLLGWSHDVEDVVQEVFLAALRSAPSFRGDSNLATWLARITINKCRSHQRRRLLWMNWFAGRGMSSQESAQHGASADQDSIRSETCGRVREAIRDLPLRLREVMVLRYLEQMPADEVAKVLRIERNAVEVRLHRARERLRSVLGDMVKD